MSCENQSLDGEKKLKKPGIPSKHYIVPMPSHKCKCQCQCHYTHLTLHFMCWLTLAQPMDATAVVCQEPALAQPTATLSMVRDIFLNGSLVSTQFRDAGDLEHPQHVTLALLFCTRHFMLLCNWAMIGEILLVYHNLIMIH